MPPDVVGVAPMASGSAESAEGDDGPDSIGEEVRGVAVWVGPDGIGVGGPSVPDRTWAPVQAVRTVASVAAIKY